MYAGTSIYTLKENLISSAPHLRKVIYTLVEHVVMYAARLRSGARKHYNVLSVLRGIFWIVCVMYCV